MTTCSLAFGLCSQIVKWTFSLRFIFGLHGSAHCSMYITKVRGAYVALRGCLQALTLGNNARISMRSADAGVCRGQWERSPKLQAVEQ